MKNCHPKDMTYEEYTEWAEDKDEAIRLAEEKIQHCIQKRYTERKPSGLYDLNSFAHNQFVDAVKVDIYYTIEEGIKCFSHVGKEYNHKELEWR